MRYKYGRAAISAREKILIAVTLFSIVLAGVALSSEKKIAQSVTDLERASVNDLSTEGFVTVKPLADVQDGRGLISLTSDCYRVIAGTDENQAESIRNGLDDVTGPRPNTHDLMRDLFDALDIQLIMVKVTELKGENFYGKVILQQGDIILNLDSKPSDGIALATRTGAPIYFNETLMVERGQKTC